MDEAVLLSDKIVMLTNGPAATVGEVLQVDLPARATACNWPRTHAMCSAARQ